MSILEAQWRPPREHIAFVTMDVRIDRDLVVITVVDESTNLESQNLLSCLVKITLIDWLSKFGLAHIFKLREV